VPEVSSPWAEPGRDHGYTSAGVFDFATGLRVVAERGRLMQVACEQSLGGMAALWDRRARKSRTLREFDIEAANFNAPGQIIVSGEKARIEAPSTGARAAVEKGSWRSTSPGAYHSRLMEPARAAFGGFLQSVPFAAPRSPSLPTHRSGHRRPKSSGGARQTSYLRAVGGLHAQRRCAGATESGSSAWAGVSPDSRVAPRRLGGQKASGIWPIFQLSPAPQSKMDVSSKPQFLHQSPHVDHGKSVVGSAARKHIRLRSAR